MWREAQDDPEEVKKYDGIRDMWMNRGPPPRKKKEYVYSIHESMDDPIDLRLAMKFVSSRTKDFIWSMYREFGVRCVVSTEIRKSVV